MTLFLPKSASAYASLASITVLLIAISFVAVSFGGAGMSMPTHCPLMGMDTICQMNPLEHIAAWQQMFASVLANNTSSILLLLISFLAFSLQRFRRLLAAPVLAHQVPSLRARTLVNYNPLQEAFSSGILHPKIF